MPTVARRLCLGYHVVVAAGKSNFLTIGVELADLGIATVGILGAARVYDAAEIERVMGVVVAGGLSAVQVARLRPCDDGKGTVSRHASKGESRRVGLIGRVAKPVRRKGGSPATPATKKGRAVA